ncbi:1-deoxy-D-xylulose-5-phosphate reductoisomerase [Candidatus Pelagibacter sp. HIMB123]|uniref:1-deoxy-D-xylulose-5-phosphate reductoisomerase n=1 Tax=Candidatus Pelagibacter sp. HIMB123 TaxID=3415413 RepID=UPI003F87CC80
MKKKIAILGSTGSIGKTLLDIVAKDKKNFEITLLTAHRNYEKLLNQAKKFKVKNLIISNKKTFEKIKKKNIKNIKIYNSFEDLNLIFSQKIDYVMSSIVGLDGLDPTIKIIKFTKKIAIANKESIICGWNLIKKELNKNKTEFIPVDSEHFSLWYGLKNSNNEDIEKIFITASGGPFYKTPLNKFKSIKVRDAINHPNWKMGRKISIDSATMINKVYEVIEAKNIFNIPLNKIDILIHPKSYIHAIIKFKNGLIKIIAHDTTMAIPIFNTLYSKAHSNFKFNKINVNKLNNLNLIKLNYKRYPITKILSSLPKNHSLYFTIIVSINDTLVDLFLKNKISFMEIQKIFLKMANDKKFVKFKKINPYKIQDIINLNKYVHLKTLKKVYKS